MKYSVLTIISLLTVSYLYSQKKDLPMNFDKATLLVFDEKIAGYDVGLPEWIDVDFTDNRLRFQAQRSDLTVSNLFVWTISGNYFSFNLKYTETSKMGNGFFPIHNDQADYQSPLATKQETTETEPKSQSYKGSNVSLEKGAELKILCEQLIKDKGRTDVGDDRKKLTFSLDGIFVRDNEFFFKVTLDNRTPLAYEVKRVVFKKKVKEDQGTAIVAGGQEFVDVMFSYEEGLGKVEAKQTKSSIYVIEKFALDKNKDFRITIFELNGDRERQLVIDEKTLRQEARDLYEALNK